MNGFGVFFSPNPSTSRPDSRIRPAQARVVAVARHDAESVHALLVQNVHRVDDQRRIGRVLACRIGVLLNGRDGVLQQHLFPGGEFRVGEIPVNAFYRRCAVVGDLIQNILYLAVRDVVGIDQHREFLVIQFHN